jgi:hypothetical protein
MSLHGFDLEQNSGVNEGTDFGLRAPIYRPYTQRDASKGQAVAALTALCLTFLEAIISHW